MSKYVLIRRTDWPKNAPYFGAIYAADNGTLTAWGLCAPWIYGSVKDVPTKPTTFATATYKEADSLAPLLQIGSQTSDKYDVEQDDDASTDALARLNSLAYIIDPPFTKWNDPTIYDGAPFMLFDSAADE
jgi:hypothetical protein